MSGILRTVGRILLLAGTSAAHESTRLVLRHAVQRVRGFAKCVSAPSTAGRKCVPDSERRPAVLGKTAGAVLGGWGGAPQERLGRRGEAFGVSRTRNEVPARRTSLWTVASCAPPESVGALAGSKHHNDRERCQKARASARCHDGASVGARRHRSGNSGLDSSRRCAKHAICRHVRRGFRAPGIWHSRVREGFSVPAGERRPGVVRALRELEDRPRRVGRTPHVLVLQHELLHRRAEERGVGVHAMLR